MYRGIRGAAAYVRHAATRMTVSISVAVLSVVLSIVILVLAALTLRSNDDALKNLITFVGAINAAAVAFVAHWGYQQSREREKLATELMEGFESLSRSEVEVLLLLYRFKKEKHDEYELTNFTKGGKLHKSLRLLRTARLVVSLNKDSTPGSTERGRFREGDRVGVRPWAETLCTRRSVRQLKLQTFDDSDWSSIHDEVYGGGLSGLSSP